jgi:hypothetical protein
MEPTVHLTNTITNLSFLLKKKDGESRDDMADMADPRDSNRMGNMTPFLPRTGLDYYVLKRKAAPMSWSRGKGRWSRAIGHWSRLRPNLIIIPSMITSVRNYIQKSYHQPMIYTCSLQIG